MQANPAETTTADADSWPPRPETAPFLNTDNEPWVGTFPGLGRVEVAADGSYTVEAEAPTDHDQETLEQREDALRFGWAELLATARRGVRRVIGVTLGRPDHQTCFIVTGDVGEIGRLTPSILEAGFAVLSDRPAPVRWDNETLLAEPCDRPFLLGKAPAEATGLTSAAVRGDTDAFAVDLPRLSETRRVAAIMGIAMRRPHEPGFEELSGHRRFEAAANLFAAGIVDPNIARATAERTLDKADDANVEAADIAASLAEHLRVAAIPFGRLLLTSGNEAEDFAQALPWLQEVMAA